MASVTKQENGRWLVRWWSPDGQQRKQRFDRARDARSFAATVESDKARGSYIDPRAGRMPFKDFAETWLRDQTFDESTREGVERQLRRHLFPTFGRVQLRSIRPSAIQAWIRGRQIECAPRSVRVMLSTLSTILGAAVEDGRIVKNPCASSAVRAPKVEQRKIAPWSHEQVEAVIAAHPEQYRAMPVVGAGCGLRQGEVFGLRASEVDFLGRKLHVRQQLKIVSSRRILAPPKGGKTRAVPLPDVVAIALSEHLRAHPPGDDGLIFTTSRGEPLWRNSYNVSVWKPALIEAGIEPTRANGFHALRHYYASVLLDAGVSIRALADHLGHGDPGFTLRTYTHLMPASEDRARGAVDAAFSSSRAQDVSKDAL